MANETYPTITPYLIVKDAEGQLAFLENGFGAKVRSMNRRENGEVMHAELELGDSLVMVAQELEAYPARKAAFYLWVDDVDVVYERALGLGASSESKPEDKPYGHRCAGLIDLNGNTWWLAAPVKPQQ
jgi:PhnB protein